ncbi:MAG: hypothetical protein ACRD68_16190 [Pyrinomonadaceae bacterium]
MYKPNFCAECGARVERERWRPWTSGRFCAACDRRFRGARLKLSALVCACLLAVGFVTGRAIRPAPPPLVIERAGDVMGSATTTTPRAGTLKVQTGSVGEAPAASQSFGPHGTAAERATDPEEIVSVCGARTKKGTPCSRRVRGTGRCWQHKGQPAVATK